MKQHIRQMFDQICLPDQTAERIESALLQAESDKEVQPMKQRKILLPVVATAALLVAFGVVAYATGGQFLRLVESFGGNATIVETVEEDGTTSHTTTLHTEDLTEPVEVLGGAMYFVANGESLDITGQISDTQAYVYSYEDDAAITHYLVVGGTLEKWGYAEFMQDAEGVWLGGYSARVDLPADGTEPVWLTDAKTALEIPW